MQKLAQNLLTFSVYKGRKHILTSQYTKRYHTKNFWGELRKADVEGDEYY